MKALRGYFQFEDVLASVTNVAGVKFAFFLDDAATGMEGLVPVGGDGIIYDLGGRRVAKPVQRGIYIMDGKKIAVK